MSSRAAQPREDSKARFTRLLRLKEQFQNPRSYSSPEDAEQEAAQYVGALLDEFRSPLLFEELERETFVSEIVTLGQQGCEAFLKRLGSERLQWQEAFERIAAHRRYWHPQEQPLESLQHVNYGFESVVNEINKRTYFSVLPPIFLRV